MPIARNPRNPRTFHTVLGGKEAITEYKVLESRVTCDFVELKPVTGRTHQLRVHLKQVGHPIVGDPLYGNRAADRLYLHAKSLEITVPSGERLVFEATVPAEFAEFLRADS